MPNEDVGYGRPPKHAQFKKGQSGNPAGRPKGSQNLAAVLERILREPVTIRENGRSKTLTKLEYAVEQLAKKATAGNLGALKHFMSLVRLAEERTPQQEAQVALAEADQKVLQNILKRIENITIKSEDEGHAPDHE